MVENLKNKILNLFKNKAAYKSLVISGRDENNVSFIFNNNLLQKKIPIKALINTSGVFDIEHVFTQVISWLNDDKKNNK